jgi:hypothetical protein
MRLFARGFNAASRTVFGLTLDGVEVISDNPLHGVITPEVIATLRKSNDKKVKQKLRELGNKWVCHPDMHVRHKDLKEYL